jgi:hypothetical protein
VALVAGLSYLLVVVITRAERTFTAALALALASLTLPLNATGALSLATVLGWYGQLTAR